MKLNGFMGVAMLAMVIGAGCSTVVTSDATDTTDGGQGTMGNATGESSGDAASGAQCKAPEIQEDFVIEDCTPAPGVPETSMSIDGAFETVSGGYHIVGTTETVTVTVKGTTPPIPAGTFVHMTYWCSPPRGGYSIGGYFVALQNLPTLAGKANPTEAGGRLWFAGGAGSKFGIPADALPFTITWSPFCTLYFHPAPTDTGEPGDDSYVGTLDIQGAGLSASIAPGNEGEVTVPSGAHAGKYRSRNDYIVVKLSGLEAISDEYFTVSRAD